ncbi:MAG: ABC transporter substrate-binding protein [Opitutales bacterium]
MPGSRTALLLVFALTAGILPLVTGCMPQKRDPAEEARKLRTAFAEALAKAEATVARTLPATGYMTNEPVPVFADLARPAGFDAVTDLRVAIPDNWDLVRVYWLVGESLGFFERAGIRLSWQTVENDAAALDAVRSGQVDLAMVGQASGLVRYLAAEPAARDTLVSIAAVFARNTDVLLSIDQSVPAAEASGRTPEARDLWGRIIGAQDNRSWELSLFLDSNGIPRHRVKLVRVGWNPVNLLNNRAHWMTANGFSQPEELEHRGHRNWIALPFHEAVHPDHGLLTVVRRDTLADRADALHRYNRGLLRSVNYVLNFPGRSAERVRPALDRKRPVPRLARQLELLGGYIRNGTPGQLIHQDPVALDAMTARLLIADQLNPDDETE